MVRAPGAVVAGQRLALLEQLEESGLGWFWASDADGKLSFLSASASSQLGRDPGDQKKRQVVIDFEASEALPLTAEFPKAEVTGGEGVEVSHVQVFKNEFGKSWRVIFSLSPKAEGKGSGDIRCALKAGERAVSEIWSYPWKALSNK